MVLSYDFFAYLVAIFGFGGSKTTQNHCFFDVFQRFVFSALGALGGWLFQVSELLIGALELILGASWAPSMLQMASS